jgi:transposase-like protein
MDTSPQAHTSNNPDNHAVQVTRRRYRSVEERRRIVEKALVKGASVARVAQEHGVNANLLFNWRRLYYKGRLGGRAKKLLPAKAGDTAPAKRSWRQWSIETKQKIVAATLVPGANVKEIAQAHGVRPSLVYDWRKKFGRKGRTRTAAQADLLPVTVREASGNRSNGMAPIRAIEIDLPKGRMRIMGADAVLLRTVLELLR